MHDGAHYTIGNPMAKQWAKTQKISNIECVENIKSKHN